MADFPRVKWVNFDGNTIPFTEPQHFTGNGDETVRTGHDNPLPVANYTQNESGLWLPTSKENPMPTQVTGSNVKDEDALPVKSRKVETYSSDRGIFSIEVSPGSTYYANITFENGYITGSTGGDMRGYSKIAVGVQRQAGEHEYTLEVRSKAFGTNRSINQIEKRDGPNMVKLIEMKLNYHSTSIRIINNSEEVQNYQLAVSAFPI